MTLSAEKRGHLHSAVVIACAVGFTAAVSVAYHATEFQLVRRNTPLAVSTGLFLAGFLVSADTKGRSPWLEISAAAAALGWLIVVFTVLLVR